MDLQNLTYVGQAIFYTGCGVGVATAVITFPKIMDAIGNYKQKVATVHSHAEVVRIEKEGEVARKNKEHELTLAQQYNDAKREDLELREREIAIVVQEAALTKDPNFQNLQQIREDAFNRYYKQFKGDLIHRSEIPRAFLMAREAIEVTYGKR